MSDEARKKLGRRRLSTSGGVGAAFAGLHLLPGSIRRALAVPASNVMGSIMVVQHVVTLMQEKRSIDHRVGTLPGVRGLGDRAPIPLPSGKLVSAGSWPHVYLIIPSPVWAEHPSPSSPLQGASFTQPVLDIIVSNPELWSKTAFLITFDEHDDVFDHVPPPAVPSQQPDGTFAGKTPLGTPLGGEYYIIEVGGILANRPYGLGPRVAELPDMNEATAEDLVIEGLPPVAVPDQQRLPLQAPGLRYARALPYALHAHLREVNPNRVEVRFENVGRAGAVLHVYDRLHLDRFPRRYTVEAGKCLTDSYLAAEGRYALSIIGPNGLLREFQGTLSAAGPAPDLELEYHPAQRSIGLRARTAGSAAVVIDVTPGAHEAERLSLALPCDGRLTRERWSIAHSADWYDVSVRCDARPGWYQRFAGRMETGRHGVSDPVLGLA